MNQDTTEIKEKILQTIRLRGPSLPVHIAKEINQSMLFSSAFLSELLSEKRLKMSYMRVGSSPIYYLQGQEYKLENFSQYLKSKEKEAYTLIKEKKFLKDSDQDPAIRVALRNIKDFAIPFENNNEIFFRYFTIPQSDFISKKEEKVEIEISTEEKKKSPQKKEIKQEKPKEKKKDLDIFDKKRAKKKSKSKTSQKKNEKFFNKVKEFVSEKGFEIIDIETFSKNDLILRIKTNKGEELLIAFNKKKISETDIINAYKKASELSLTYILLSMGEPLKKIKNLIEAASSLSSMEKLET